MGSTNTRVFPLACVLKSRLLRGEFEVWNRLWVHAILACRGGRPLTPAVSRDDCTLRLHSTDLAHVPVGPAGQVGSRQGGAFLLGAPGCLGGPT